jgi:hypothetical protein
MPDPVLHPKVLKGLSGGKGGIRAGIIVSLLLLVPIAAVLFFMRPSIKEKNAVTTAAHVAAPEFPRALSAASRAPKSAEEGRKPVATESGLHNIITDRKASPVAAMPGGDVARAFSRKTASRATRREQAPYRFKRADLVKMLEVMKSNNSFGSLWFRDGDISSADREFVESESGKIGFDEASKDSAVTEAVSTKTLEGSPVADQDIGVLDHRPLALPQYHWQPDSLVTPEKPKKRYDYLLKDHWGIIAGFTPLRTFQILTVRPGNGVVYQNFVLPTKISAQTVGYKFSAGVERKGFQLLLNYGQFKQSYRYEIATSEFLVGPDPSGNYQVVRKGIPQEENSIVRLVGVSVKKHTVRRSPFLRNYFGDVGAEFSRDLGARKNMVWVNAGFGKELFAGNNVVMTVGPYLEYSLSKLRNADNPFKIQPYQIGLSVGLRYTKK